MQCSAGNSWVLPFTDRLHPLKTAACGMVLNLSPSRQNLHGNGPRNLWEINHSTSNPFKSRLTTQRPCVHGSEPFWPRDIDLSDIRQALWKQWLVGVGLLCWIYVWSLRIRDSRAMSYCRGCNFASIRSRFFFFFARACQRNCCSFLSMNFSFCQWIQWLAVQHWSAHWSYADLQQLSPCM